MWKTIDIKLQFGNEWISVYENLVQTSKGNKIKYTTTKSSDIVVIIPIIDNKIIMVQCYRYPTNSSHIEFPAGHLEKNETITQCAKRELLEETGYSSQNIEFIHSYYVSPGRSDQMVHIFRAIDLVKKHQNLENDEELEVIQMTKNEIKNSILNGTIKNPSTIIGFYLCI